MNDYVSYLDALQASSLATQAQEQAKEQKLFTIEEESNLPGLAVGGFSGALALARNLGIKYIKETVSSKLEQMGVDGDTVDNLLKGNITDAIQGKVSGVVDNVKGMAQEAIDTAQSTVQDAVGSVQSVAEGALGTAQSAVEGAVSSAQSVAEGAMESTTGTLRGTISSLSETLDNAVSGNTSILDSVLPSLRSIGDIFQTGSPISLVSSAQSTIDNVVSTARTTMQSLPTLSEGMMSDLAGQSQQEIANATSISLSDAEQGTQGVLSRLTSMFGSSSVQPQDIEMVNFASGTASDAIGSASSTATSVANTLSEAVSSTTEAVASTASTVGEVASEALSVASEALGPIGMLAGLIGGIVGIFETKSEESQPIAVLNPSTQFL